MNCEYCNSYHNCINRYNKWLYQINRITHIQYCSERRKWPNTALALHLRLERQNSGKWGQFTEIPDFIRRVSWTRFSPSGTQIRTRTEHKWNAFSFNLFFRCKPRAKGLIPRTPVTLSSTLVTSDKLACVQTLLPTKRARERLWVGWRFLVLVTWIFPRYGERTLIGQCFIWIIYDKWRYFIG
jgi:hypothetical protein